MNDVTVALVSKSDFVFTDHELPALVHAFIEGVLTDVIAIESP